MVGEDRCGIDAPVGCRPEVAWFRGRAEESCLWHGVQETESKEKPEREIYFLGRANSQLPLPSRSHLLMASQLYCPLNLITFQKHEALR